MKTSKKNKDEMRAEYDFSDAKRGKFYRPSAKGFTAYVRKSDGIVETRHYELAEGAVWLAPDVREYFPDSDSVNEALRSLIRLMDELPSRRYKSRAASQRQG